MPVLDAILLVIRWAHALAAVTWIGGSLFMLLAARPALQNADADGLVGRMLAAEFRPIVVTAIAVLIVTGVILTVDRLTSDAAGIAYTGVLVAKIVLAVYAFAVAWLLPRWRGKRYGRHWPRAIRSGRADHRRRHSDRAGRRAGLAFRARTAWTMRTDLLDILACPVCKGELTLQAETIAPDHAPDAGEVLTGSLTCSPCDERYPITDGIPNLLPPDLRDAEAAAGR